MSYATYIPFACSALPQHTLPLDWAQRYADPTICTWHYGTRAGTLADQFGVHHTWTETSSHHSSLKYVPQFRLGLGFKTDGPLTGLAVPWGDGRSDMG